ncbi:MAG: hypothetical protein HQK72_00130 [Desulfamplus sp.]|nr:hypothetical protein [Desulfamplus sp.]
MQKISCLCAFLVFTLSSSVYSAAIPISKIGDLPLNQAIEAVFPDGTIRIVSSAEQDIVQTGIPKATAKRIAERMAVSRAKASLAAFIYGSTFEETTSVQEAMKINGNEGQYTSEQRNQVVETMREAALKGVEVIEVDRQDTIIRVVVGVSFDSMQTADNFRDRTENYSPIKNQKSNVDSQNDEANNSRQKHWVHPSLQ